MATNKRNLINTVTNTKLEFDTKFTARMYTVAVRIILVCSLLPVFYFRRNIRVRKVKNQATSSTELFDSLLKGKWRK